MLNDVLDLDGLGAFADVLQVLNYAENLTQTSNDKILNELQKQNNLYLEQLIKNQQEIIARLERIENVRFTEGK